MSENRITNAGVVVETRNVSERRLTSAGVVVETRNVSERRLTSAGIIIEWVPIILISVSDNLTIGETINESISGYLSVSENLSIGESAALLVPELLVNVTSAITVYDSVPVLHDYVVIGEDIDINIESPLSEDLNIVHTPEILDMFGIT